MSHYRKIDVRIWNDEKFNRLTIQAKMAFFFVLTHPNMTSVGAMRGTIEGLSSELEVIPEAFAEVLEEGLVLAYPESKIIVAKNFLKYNKPESPNVIRAWGKAFEMLPECNAKKELFLKVKGLVQGYGEGFKKAFSETFAEEYG
jgi:hypothetical protein